MKDMTILTNKKIVNKETGEIRQVVSIDEENRKIYSVPVDEPEAEPGVMAAASYDRRWKLYEEPATDDPENDEPQQEVPEAGDAENDELQQKAPETNDAENDGAEPQEPMKMGETITQLESIFDKLNEVYFEGTLPRAVITIQTTPKAYGHCSTKKIWKSETEAMHEINLGAEYINRPKEQTCATLLHEMVHLYCAENEISDTCQHGRYHNKAFKAECEARDLEVEYDRANGYAHTKPTEAFKQKLGDAGIDLSIRFARIPPKAKAKAERAKAHTYICPQCGQKVRSTGLLNLICGDCELSMEMQD